MTVNAATGETINPVPPTRNCLRPAQPHPLRRLLRPALVFADVTALIAGWSLFVAAIDAAPSIFWSVAFVVLGLAVLRSQRLYRARVARSWTLETTKIGRACVILALAFVTVDPFGGAAGKRTGILLLATTFVTMVVLRALYRLWLRSLRRRDTLTTPVVVIGKGPAAAALVEAIADDPSSGFRVAGVIGRTWDQTAFNDLWMGDTSEAVDILERLGVSGAIIEATGLPQNRLDELSRALLRAGVHVQIAPGIRMLDYRRLTVGSLAREIVLYLEPSRLSGLQRAAKRALDVVGATAALMLLAPIIGLIALTIRMEDGGPVLFRQHRVGKDGQPFEVLKFRSMVVDAESQRGELIGANHRTGPLFKMAGDPRVTRVGRVIRATSLDEVPQFINVLRGEMSLVGPRPALPEEVEAFDRELTDRTTVKPGITGLWQVEARDSSSFTAYRRLDLFYLRNWSLGLDLAILVATPVVVLARALSAVPVSRRSSPETAPSLLD